MTFGDIIPSLRSSLPPPQLDAEIWPMTARHGRGGFAVASSPLVAVRDGHAKALVRRETLDDLLAREAA